MAQKTFVVTGVDKRILRERKEVLITTIGYRHPEGKREWEATPGPYRFRLPGVDQWSINGQVRQFWPTLPTHRVVAVLDTVYTTSGWGSSPVSLVRCGPLTSDEVSGYASQLRAAIKKEFPGEKLPICFASALHALRAWRKKEKGSIRRLKEIIRSVDQIDLGYDVYDI